MLSTVFFLPALFSGIASARPAEQVATVRDHGLEMRQDSSGALQVNIGRTGIDYSVRKIDDFVISALVTLCGTTGGCDAGTPYAEGPALYPFESFGDLKFCTLSATASGNYDNQAQRDDMINVLATSLFNAGTGKQIERTVEDSSICDHQGRPGCDTTFLGVNSGPNFAQVVANKPDGSNLADMSITVKMDCSGTFGVQCPSFVTKNIKDALSVIPFVGIGAPQLINVICQ